MSDFYQQPFPDNAEDAARILAAENERIHLAFAALKEENEQLDDVYTGAVDTLEAWHKKRAKARLPMTCQGSVIDGIASLCRMIETLEEENERQNKACRYTSDLLDQALAEIKTLKARVAELKQAAGYLRTCQMAYMLERGNEELGKAVGEAAIRLDEILKEPANEG